MLTYNHLKFTSSKGEELFIKSLMHCPAYSRGYYYRKTKLASDRNATLFEIKENINYILSAGKFISFRVLTPAATVFFLRYLRKRSPVKIEKEYTETCTIKNPEELISSWESKLFYSGLAEWLRNNRKNIKEALEPNSYKNLLKTIHPDKYAETEYIL